MEKKKRLSILRTILEKEAISDQQALIQRLDHAGVNASQPSLSRDLRELGAQRLRRENGLFCYVLPEARPAAYSSEVFNKRFANSVTGIKRSGFIVLVFAPPGEASLVGRLLDTSSLPGLSGTVAGDDTIICIADNEKDAKKLEKKLKEIVV